MKSLLELRSDSFRPLLIIRHVQKNIVINCCILSSYSYYLISFNHMQNDEQIYDVDKQGGLADQNNFVHRTLFAQFIKL